MSQDLSEEAYAVYLEQKAQMDRVLTQIKNTHLPLPDKTYEEWQETLRHRDHPRWPEYMDARRVWKGATFRIRYSTHAGREDTLPQFPTFEDWLEQKHDAEETS
jgi:hypothetical protein